MKSKVQTRFTGIIPARYGSSRFPGKPLAVIGGRSMIQRVYEQASKALDEVWVATDDERILSTVNAFGGRAVMTSSSHRSGTDRCAEAMTLISGGETDGDTVVINIQGDEPFIMPEQIQAVMECFNEPEVQIATLVRKFDAGEDPGNVNQPKVVLSKNMDALYFSRSVIPYIRDAGTGEWLSKHLFYRHIGLYGYRTDTLMQITKLPQSPLEIAESLEQLRWLENGFKIRCSVTEWESLGIDTPSDIGKAEALLKALDG
ncbi:MAG TPA: 3-deoxy-manno-octulosonate cytidylyltransferase [Bacteroidales bacterium]|nr:3-deoxy-manno-octulosonate cytidylyltransferase [Bacteroidales bacterium]